MGAPNDDLRYWCQGRPLRWREASGVDAPFLSDRPANDESESPLAASDGEHHVLPEQEEEEGARRTITMIVFRNGRVWEAETEIDICHDEESVEWWAVAIAAIDTSVDMAIATET